MRARMRSAPRALLRDQSGISAVEFALVLPVALIIYFGIVELTLGQRASQKLDLVAHTLSDLAAQQLTGGSASGQAGMDETTIQSIFTAATTLMSPFSTTGLKMTISEVTIAADATQASGFKASVNWTIVKNSGTARPCKIGGVAKLNAVDAPPVDPNSMPTSYTAAKTVAVANPDGTTSNVSVAPTIGSIIVADVVYPYQPARGLFQSGSGFSGYRFLPSTINMARTSYSPVRNSYTPNHIQYYMTTGTNCSASP
jgi:Flp pilus assembly protein TadG